VEKNYFELKEIASSAKTKPGVLTEVKYGEIWYVPGGKSFMAAFFEDASSNYIWKDDLKTGSLHLSFEEVYVKAKDADFWLNMSLVKSKDELKALEPRYAEFNAFKTGNLYNNIKNTNAKGYSDYWETGIMFPDRVLSDLVLIFHPELKPQIKNDLYYYRKIN
jgi:iron complex transport system substrate-binding protein